MNERMVIPCMRGTMGTWVHYSCTMRLSDIADLVGFARELHQIKKLSDNIQRDLNEDRGVEIAKYLVENEDRFFNSLVVAIYDGDPQWHDIGGLRPNSKELERLEFPEYAQNCLGFLSITKNEKLFALDGQHRLAGIKKAVLESDEVKSDLMNVIIVAHSNSEKGKKKSRRLFTTLNKKAKLVSKDAIIAMDEDDIAACITRNLIESEDFPFFTEENISFIHGAVRDQTSITSIVNIYDNIQKLVAFKIGCRVSELDAHTYSSNSDIEGFVKHFFTNTFLSSSVLMSISNDELSAGAHRDKETGGYLLVRPIGWDLYTDVVLRGLEKGAGLEEVIRKIHDKDLNLSGESLKNILWSTKTKRILKATAAKERKAIKELLK